MLSQNIPLKKYSSIKIGGPASYFCEVNSVSQLKQVIKQWREIDGDLNKIFVLGEGTNILFSDSGYDGLVIKNNINLLERKGTQVLAGGGMLMPTLINFCSQNALSGFEWAGGLPGTVGGGIRGNAGAFLGEIGDSILEVESLDLRTFKIKKRNRKECQFGYRQSVFKTEEGKKEVILYAKFKLKKGDREEIKTKTQEKVDYRIERHPLDLPNVGSAFKNVPTSSVSSSVKKEFEKSIKPDPFPVIPTAKLLIGAGLKGKSIGGAKFSEKHPNFIVNFNRAKAEDVLALISIAKKSVKEKYGVDLEEEIMFV
ncbi:MAG: UDP-N-acetylmuramate dehydrogenase [Candidatus Levybacteria bacterium]|nr:UDP-N-acetylmuramate dehydrogenase [Candidatus Levybacteria bacterium]